MDAPVLNATEGSKTAVREFWNAEPCGSKHADATAGTSRFFDEVEAKRYELEPFIPRFAEFEATRGQRVLEIGVGLGTDFLQFAQAGADLTGVDLTPRAIELVGRRLAQAGLEADLRVADAERLPFDSGSFDVVYSWGVLHHTPNPELAFAEAQRVLKPGGRLCVMVYARRSWVGYGLWARHGLLAGRPWRSLASVIADHMESQGTRAYTPEEVRRSFGSLEQLRIERVLTPYDERVGGPLARAVGDRSGWFMVVRGRRADGG